MRDDTPRSCVSSGWSPIWRRKVLIVSIVWATMTIGTGGQVRPPAAAVQEPAPSPETPKVTIDPAERALVEGKFDEVDTLAAAADVPPAVRLVKAKADSARGRYEPALAILSELAAADPLGDARLELGLLLDRLGRRAEAQAHWQAIVASPIPERTASRLLRLGRALVALGQARRANVILQEAATLAPADPRVPTAWGELFLDKHNAKEAVDLFAIALKSDERWVPALLGLARARAEDDPGVARAALNRVFAIDSASVDARLILAELALDDRRLEDARAELDRALAVNPADQQALGLLAGLAFIEDRRDDAERIAAQALAINPRAGDIYRVMGAQAASHYRFDDAVALLQKAAALDPESSRIQAELGMHLLRTGDEDAARASLDRAFKRDPYDVVTYNLLSMLDTLDKFQTVTDRELVVKLHADEVSVMRDSVVTLAREAVAALSPRYGFTPRGPILIEMFPKHDDFAVRTLGLPGMVGALGACFGRVVTLDSPRARPPGTFNWGATLWHEMAHVFALQLSEQRVARWVTEGASVFEERRANPAWGREGEHQFLEAYARNELIPLAELNSGFSSARTINLAYHQASLVVEHLVGRFGDAGLQKFLKAFATGQSPEAALQGALGLSMAQLQTSFDGYLVERFGQARTALAAIEEEPAGDAAADAVAAAVARADRHPGNYGVQLQAGRLLVQQGQLDEARRVLERAAALVPQTMGDDSPRTTLADIAVKQGHPARARAELVKVLAEGHTAMDASRRLLALALEGRDRDAARQAAERIVALDPFDGAARAELGRQAMAREDVATALRELELALKLGPQDPAASHTDLAEAYLLAGQPDPAKRHLLSALESAPRYERAQELLLKIVDGR